ncbi:MAG: CBS domain-containing protein, partial [Planctomycetia bacterium]|nr:CBS domain-containing protein [Planctomycetia bacterium]
VRRLPIVDDAGHVVGIVTLDDLLRLLSRELFNLAEGIKIEMARR